MSILISGGAGYIGSHTAKSLSRAGFEPVVYDNLSTGHRWAVKWGPFIEADLCDQCALKDALKRYNVTAAIHFAAYAYVGESVGEPRRYFENNVTNSLNLLNTLLDAGVGCLVFSSSCAVYGVPQSIPISESHSKLPVNPYGESKLFIERALDWYGRAYGLRWAALRYFNAAGADPDGELGEVHDPEPHLVPRLIEAAKTKVGSVEIYGVDYPTEDGTAVRDYVHVSDLADAHVSALQHLLARGESTALNLGTGRGASVRQVVTAVERVSGAKIDVKPAPRRPGDPPELIADASAAQRLLGWRPKFSSLHQIVSSAWEWHSRTVSVNNRPGSEGDDGGLSPERVL
jgi:UDP-glucose-4-epimerase GalE